MRMIVATLWGTFFCALILVQTLPARADALPSPAGTVVLTLTGAIGTGNDDSVALFDMDMLRALPATTFKTSTTWTVGISSFTGVSLKALLGAVGAKGQTLRAMAINDYAVDIPVSDAVDGGPIVAYLMDEKPMPVRDKGPLWVVYPFDSNAAYRTEQIYSRSIWQLNAIDVK